MTCLGTAGVSRRDPDETNTAKGYTTLLASFCEAMGIKDAVFVGWSLGGHLLLEATDLLPSRGYFIVAAPPLSGLQDFGPAFLTTKALELVWKKDFAPGDFDPMLDIFIGPGHEEASMLLKDDMQRSDGRARRAFFMSLPKGWYRDERRAVEELRVPIAFVHGSGDKLVNLAYIESLRIPTLWRGRVQVIEGATHTPHMEQPGRFNLILNEFLDSIYGQTQRA